MAKTVADEKKYLRAVLSECRDAFAPSRAVALGELVQRRLLASDLLSLATPADRAAIILYAATSNEVSTDLLMAESLAAGRAVFFPRVELATGRMIARRVRTGAELQSGAFGIMEPPASAEPLDSTRFSSILVCVPGLAFGLEGQRLGRGGGHYDRFLAELGPEAISVGLAYSFQLLAALPESEHDRRLNYISTESALHRACDAPLPARSARIEEVHPGGSNLHSPGIHSWWRGLFTLGEHKTAAGRR